MRTNARATKAADRASTRRVRAPSAAHTDVAICRRRARIVTLLAHARECSLFPRRGDVYVTPHQQAESPSGLLAALVRFTPGAHTNWHSHALGQTLHVTEGVGLVITRDGTVIRMRAGGTAWTPPGEGHWHGGSTGNVMCHIAMLEGTSDGDGTTWLDPVSDDQVRRRQRRARDAVSTRPPNHAPERDAADPEPVRPRRV